LVAVGLLGWRARLPLAVLVGEVALAGLGTVLYTGPSADWSIVPVSIALYAVAVRRPGGTSLPATVVTWLCVGGWGVVFGRPASTLVSALFIFLSVTSVALYVRSHRALVASLRERAEQAERERRWSTNQAVAEERVRIARELHDVVAHHVSLLVVQAGAVRATLQPGEHSYEVVDSMVQGGRQAMTELRDMLGALRVADLAPDALSPPLPQPEGADVLSRRPRPDVRQLDDLVSGARHAGLPVELSIHGRPSDTPSAAAFAAYRIVQEGLTNVVRHAPGAATVVQVRHLPDGISLVIRNHGAAGGSPAASAGAGHGLLGMRERAALCGGWVHAGPLGNASPPVNASPPGYEVEAWLPHSGVRLEPVGGAW
jgi:signal transduction histidine kinase